METLIVFLSGLAFSLTILAINAKHRRSREHESFLWQFTVLVLYLLMAVREIANH